MVLKMATRKKTKATKKSSPKAKKAPARKSKSAVKKSATKKKPAKTKPAAKKKPSPKKKAVRKKAAPARKLQGSAWRRSTPVKAKKVIDSQPLPTLEAEDATAAEITRRLREALSPAHISIENLSGRHAGHAESKKHGGGHYKVSLVSDLFEGLSRLHRERWVTSLLEDLLKDKKIHAISLSLNATDEVKGIYGL